MDDTKSDAGLRAVMSEDELKAWEALPPSVQLEKLRAAIDDGVKSGVSDRSMEDILSAVLARHPQLVV